MKEETKESLDLYANHHVSTGSFLRAVLENDLMGAIGRADNQNHADLREICMYVYNELEPGTCWGSKEKVKEWLWLRFHSVECDHCTNGGGP